MRAWIVMMGILALGCTPPGETPQPERIAVFGFFVDGVWRPCEAGTVVAVINDDRTQIGCVTPEIAQAQTPHEHEGEE